MQEREESNLPKSTPLDFWNYAKAFARAGAVVKCDIGNGPYLEPVFYLFGQSIELSLKAFLLGRGIPIGKLSRKPYGHDLRFLLKTADEHCLRQEIYLYPRDRGAIMVLSKPYLQRRFQYSRLELGTGYILPDVSFLERAANRLVYILRPYCEQNSEGQRIRFALIKKAFDGKYLLPRARKRALGPAAHSASR